MSRCLMTVLVAGLLVGIAPAAKEDDAVKDEAANKDIDNLQGTWKSVSQEQDGKALTYGEGQNFLTVIDKTKTPTHVASLLRAIAARGLAFRGKRPL